jgi:hypothetical protein
MRNRIRSASLITALAFMGLEVAALMSPGYAASDQSVEGWAISPGNQGPLSVCVASEPSEAHAMLSLAAVGPGFEMIVTAPDFPKEKAPYNVTLAFDGKSPVTTVALGDRGVIQILVNRGDSAKTIAAASHISVTVEGRTHDFSLRNAAAALDAVAHCAGEPTLSEQTDEAPTPITGGGNWRLSVTIPGVFSRVCSARIDGDQIDTNMLLNNSGDLVLIGGHKDWATWGSDVPLQLAVDGEPPLAMTAKTALNLITVLVKDPSLVQRLRDAKTLDWTIPTGHVRGDVAGLGVALDAMKACKAGVAARR